MLILSPPAALRQGIAREAVDHEVAVVDGVEVMQLEAWELLGVKNTDKCKVFASPHGSRKGNVT
jgi:hypothetical protein